MRFSMDSNMQFPFGWVVAQSGRSKSWRPEYPAQCKRFWLGFCPRLWGVRWFLVKGHLYYGLLPSHDNGYLALAPDAPGQVIPQLGEKQYRLNDSCLSGVWWYGLLYHGRSVNRGSLWRSGGLFVMTTQGQGTLWLMPFGSIKKIELHNQK